MTFSSVGHLQLISTKVIAIAEIIQRALLVLVMVMRKIDDVVYDWLLSCGGKFEFI